MEKRKIIRIAMRITEAIIQILKEELNRKEKQIAAKSKKTKRVLQNSRQSSTGSSGHNPD